MNTHCPECSEKYEDRFGPQPDDYICGPCGLRLALQAILEARRPVVILEQSTEQGDNP